MTNEELLATAEVAVIKASKAELDVVDLQKAINTLRYAMDAHEKETIDFCRAVLLTELAEIKR